MTFGIKSIDTGCLDFWNFAFIFSGAVFGDSGCCQYINIDALRILVRRIPLPEDLCRQEK